MTAAGWRAGWVLAALLSASVALADPVDAARALITTAMHDDGVAGLSVAVMQHGRVVWADGFGEADREHGVPASADTAYEIGSLGKQFTAVAAESLAAAGAIDLDAPLRRYLPTVPPSFEGVTLRHLLVHQSGFAQIAPPESTLIDLARDYSAAEYTALATSEGLEFVPGTANAYSDTGYVLLGFALDAALHGFYGDYLDQTVFRPLGMDSTRIIDTDHPPAAAAQGYEFVDGAFVIQQPVSASLNRTADGSLWSSVLDLARWESALQGDHVLASATLQRMMQAAPLADGREGFYHYGEGWEANRLRGVPVVEYDGSWQGFHSAMARYPTLGLMVVVLGNSADFRAQRLLHDIAGLFDVRAKPYREPGIVGGCEMALLQWLAQPPADPALRRELAAIGTIWRVGAAEAAPWAAPDAWVYRVYAQHMDDWMTVTCHGDSVQLLDLVREY